MSEEEVIDEKIDTDIEILLDTLLDSDNLEDRAEALAKLEVLGPDMSQNDLALSTAVLKKARAKEEVEKLKVFVDKLLNQFWKHKKALEFDGLEKPMSMEQIRQKVATISSELSTEEPEIIEMDYEEPEHLSFELGAPARKKPPKKRHISESALIRKNSFRFMHSNRRFPFHTLYIDFIRILAGLFFILFILLALHSLWLSRFLEFFIFAFAAIAGTFSILLSSEIIRFILDFHDSNYTNTKVRIKTLKVLEKINENLKK